jgi:hypothetical protein
MCRDVRHSSVYGADADLPNIPPERFLNSLLKWLWSAKSQEKAISPIVRARDSKKQVAHNAIEAALKNDTPRSCSVHC